MLYVGREDDVSKGISIVVKKTPTRPLIAKRVVRSNNVIAIETKSGIIFATENRVKPGFAYPISSTYDDHYKTLVKLGRISPKHKERIDLLTKSRALNTERKYDMQNLVSIAQRHDLEIPVEWTEALEQEK